MSSVHFAPYGIRVNSVYPGPSLCFFSSVHETNLPQMRLTPPFHFHLLVETDIWDAVKQSPEHWKEVEKLVSGVTPLKRMAKPEEVATAVLFLASDDSSYVNGMEMVVDGGFMACNGLGAQGV